MDLFDLYVLDDVSRDEPTMVRLAKLESIIQELQSDDFSMLAPRRVDLMARPYGIDLTQDEFDYIKQKSGRLISW